ncbi:MAG: hypothetical protein J5814_02385 [Bacteroidaceae bacterium]|nr:hypothetical protein [Bacteroidaceae bacterium]
MANIMNLQMWKTICTNNRIGVSKSMLGLRKKVTYLPTESPIEARVMGYSPETGARLKYIFEAPAAERGKAAAGFHPQQVDNGNYLLELCTSRDGSFVAVLLLRYMLMNYEPITDVLVFEKADAKIIWQMFQ